MTTALKAMEDQDRDHLAAKRFADTMISMLRDYIPESARRDAWHLLAKTAFEQKFELTSFAMRKEYEAWKEMQIDALAGGLGILRMQEDGSVERIDPKDLLAVGQTERKEG